LGAPPPLKITEKGVSDGFFLTSNIHEINFPGGSVPDPGRKLTTLPRPLVEWCEDTPPMFPSFDLGAYGMRL